MGGGQKTDALACPCAMSWKSQMRNCVFMTGIGWETSGESSAAVHGIPDPCDGRALGVRHTGQRKPWRQEAFIQLTGPLIPGRGYLCGCCLNYLPGPSGETLNREGVRVMLTTASAATSIVTTRKGALKSMPEPGRLKLVRSSISAEQSDLTGSDKYFS